MTPVQLPEVPAPYALDWPKEGLTKKPNALRLWAAHMYDTGAEPLYTADQLRAYAIETVRQAANAIFAEGWYLACDWASRDDLKFDVDSPAFAADRAARLGSLFTPSEPNSDR